MRVIRLLLIVLLGILPASAQTTAQHGIHTDDLDKKCDPCTDFAQYANGSWHTANPIPAYMDRWSRRWQSGEEAKDRLKVILDDISSHTDWSKGSAEQLIGDYYGSCMDEEEIDKLGLEDAAPMLKAIRSMDGAVDLRRWIRRL